MSAFYRKLVGNRALLAIGSIAAVAVSSPLVYAQQHDLVSSNTFQAKQIADKLGDGDDGGGSDGNGLGKMRNLLLFGAPAIKKNQGSADAEEYQAIYNAIALKLREEDEYDDAIGYGPVLVRLAWHVSGTWDKSNNSGGSYGGTYRFSKEAGDPANKGLQNAASFLRPIHAIFPWVSHGDLYTLAGVVAIQEMQGPKIPWRPGRVDQPEEKTPDNGRLPDAKQDAKYVRNFFQRLDLNDREVVALLGAHALGKTHLRNSGFEGPWGAAKNVFSNEFFVNLLEEDWKLETNSAGNKQYNNDKGWMMLPTDYALVQDSAYHKLVKEYANDEGKFFEDFKAAFCKLLESGVSFPKSTSKLYFKTLDEQDI